MNRRRIASLVALVSLGGCNAVLGIEDAQQRGADAGSAGASSGAGGAGAGGNGGTAAMGGRSGAGGDAGAGGEAPVEPCKAGEEPDQAAGVFVDPRVGDDANEGSMLRPLQTLTRAATEAVARGFAKIYLAPGSYQEALTLQVSDGATPGVVSAPAGTSLSFEGGWQLDGARWRRDCADDAREKTAIASPSATGVSIQGAFKAVEFHHLSIATTTAVASAAEGQAGESCFGVRASGEGLGLRFSNVEVDACPGGKGGPVAAAVAPPPVACVQTGANCSNGMPGLDAGPGGASAGSFGAEGYVAGNGSPAVPGTPGAAGTIGPGNPNPITCLNPSYCSGGCDTSFDTYFPHGRCGCGGPGGLGGLGGPGGGASVALFVHGPGVSVDLRYTTLRARDGGDGSPGGEGSLGGTGAPGAPFPGVPSCPTICDENCSQADFINVPPQAAGGPGGKGGKGGKGGGGSGGPSFGVVSTGEVAVSRTESVLSFGRPGQGADGAPAGEAGGERQIGPLPIAP
jgi:uncharacterized protein DUF1565